MRSTDLIPAPRERSPMSVVPSEPPRRLHGDQGTALVEAGLMSPIFLFLILAIVEYGFFFSSYLAIGRASADAARTASVMGNAPNADYKIVQSIKQSTSALSPSDVKKIIVFKATGFDSVVAPACQPTVDAPIAVTGSGCNGYTGSASFNLAEVRFGCTAPNNLSQGYCPTSRKVGFAPPGGPPDYIGIYIRYNHTMLTGLFEEDHMIAETVITRVEPSEVS